MHARIPTTVYRHLFWGVLAVAATYLILFAIDVLTPVPTTATEATRAYSYTSKLERTAPPIPFYHDGCTAFPDWLPGHNFYEACLNHDIAYWLGGTEEERTAANVQLATAVRTIGPLGPFLAPIMYTAVQYGGNSWISHQLGSEWGYGWQ